MQQATARPGDLGLWRHPVAALHAFPALQLDRPRAWTAWNRHASGSSRAITQLILNLAEGTPIKLVDGGRQMRCFTDVKDGVECLFRIIENPGNTCNGRIFNIGNPDNEASIEALASMLIDQFEKHPLRDHFPPLAGIRKVESRAYYGSGYEDVQHRKPSIENARRALGWTPTIPLAQSVAETLDFFLREAVGADDAR